MGVVYPVSARTAAGFLAPQRTDSLRLRASLSQGPSEAATSLRRRRGPTAATPTARARCPCFSPQTTRPPPARLVANPRLRRLGRGDGAEPGARHRPRPHLTSPRLAAGSASHGRDAPPSGAGPRLAPPRPALRPRLPSFGSRVSSAPRSASFAEQGSELSERSRRLLSRGGCRACPIPSEVPA